MPKRCQKGCQEGPKSEIFRVQIGISSDLSSHSNLQAILKRFFMKIYQKKCDFQCSHRGRNAKIDKSNQQVEDA